MLVEPVPDQKKLTVLLVTHQDSYKELNVSMNVDQKVLMVMLNANVPQIMTVVVAEIVTLGVTCVTDKPKIIVITVPKDSSYNHLKETEPLVNLIVQ